MNGSRAKLTICLALTALATAAPVCAWELALPDTVVARDGVLSLAGMAMGPVPAAAADIVVCGGGRPGTTMTVTRAGVLRRLVARGLARDVVMRGPAETVVVFAGSAPAPLALQEAVRRGVQALVPQPANGAPASWFDLEIPRLDDPVAGDWEVAVDRNELLQPGRNLVRCELIDENRPRGFTATVVLHAFGETARARRDVARGTPLTAELFEWRWCDLGDAVRDAVVGRESLAGHSAGRPIEAGGDLRHLDLRTTPLVRAGDLVELRILRGGIAVSVKATARQDGAFGQTIPVRNELTGRLRNARVAAPGIVEWRNR